MTTSGGAGVEKQQVIPERLRGLLAGTASGATKLVVGHPFDTLKVRLQTEGSYGRFKGPLHCLSHTVKTEGIRGLYKGATPPLVGWSIIDTVMVGTYQYVRTFLSQRHPGQPLSFWEVASAGTVAGWASCFVVTPIEQVKARLQVQYADPTSVRYKGPIDCVQSLVRNNGVAGLYFGFWGTFMFRSFMSVYFGTYEMYKQALQGTGLPTAIQAFTSGGAAATTLWLVSFPTDVVKNRMMAQPDVQDRKYKTVRECWTKIYQTEGLKGFYRGFTPCLLRSIPANGFSWMAIEFVIKYLP